MKQKPTDYRNRIKALEYVDAADLTAHPGNWREHPQAQAEAMRGVLAEVGIAGALLAYRSERRDIPTDIFRQRGMNTARPLLSLASLSVSPMLSS